MDFPGPDFGPEKSDQLRWITCDFDEATEMPDWLDRERERQSSAQREEQEAELRNVVHQREVQSFIDSNELITEFIARLSEYLEVARSASVSFEISSVEKNELRLLTCVRQKTHYRSAVIREMNSTFSYERMGFEGSLYDGRAKYWYQSYSEGGVVLRRDTSGDFRIQTESTPVGTPSQWIHYRGFLKIFVPIYRLGFRIG